MTKHPLLLSPFLSLPPLGIGSVEDFKVNLNLNGNSEYVVILIDNNCCHWIATGDKNVSSVAMQWPTMMTVCYDMIDPLLTNKISD